uniref:C2H2-type domain-containing protein n=1 Tax=Corethron hystrix TaxID=216773 RepID=A0A7S1FMF2_9STRA|mmetsp:Transcript_15814/g.35597  ORF Transcript_15814/g.35597 Transcript_15814/m.35597 type:complete len:536 (+) Transcript_15814:591-2198(+)|eukprot:CAMPEP_0113303496 /NCGR_PEP_ID=MMETSP0010_2-20120614/3890_1 /TAXON_ID=216773 ORGANISM="Corethron hystrix, Strain 308" /NCGR_SAMPLE_ID=MMETSP0010_2 /ASSEMBLY_ACC=CAM_ASM_000155 /LENGTH=535 /DNA_ID=CAMNT_0000157507 /DNA_START=513 /DNA_END=2120 /DNA_ORIENTATION=- /assembly_acc=CAM_ASM_000155
MPHCQKENHDHKAKSKKDKLKKKEAALARKKASLAREKEEEEERLKLSNNIALAEGFGAYEVGCEEEEEYVAKVNLKKRNKKHLRNDIRRQEERRRREEEKRLKQEQEEKYRLEQEKLKQEAQEEDEEEEDPVTEEYLVYICLCCHKKFNTANQFKNHLESKKHRNNAKLYEEAGVIVTEVQRKEDFDDDDHSYEDDVTEEECDTDGDSINEHENGSNHSDDEQSSDEEEEYYEKPKKVGNLFSAMALFDDSSSSSSSDSDEEEDEEIEDGKECEIETKSVASKENLSEDNSTDEYEDDLDLLEDIIYQNRLQERLYPHDDKEKEEKVAEIIPVHFDDEQYDPTNFNADENRLASVQFRLQKRLAEKGIQPSQINAGYKTSDAVSMGKTLLQQVMEASIETLEEKLAAYKRHKAEYQLLGREFRFAKGNSKALPSQYTFRIDPADNQRRRENIHHTGSHYHMQAARSMQFGRSKGLMARHSSQGSRLQASRMAAKEMARVHGKGIKIGKTSKKSQQKRRGEAGSKKSGGTATSEK